MKIDFYISSLSGGGAEKVVVTVAEQLSKLGHQVGIISLEKRERFYIPHESIDYISLPPKKKCFLSVTHDLKRIYKCLKGRNADVSISFLSRCNILLLLSAMLSNRKVIVCDRNNPQMEHSKAVFLVSQLLYLRANRVLVQTNAIKSMYKLLSKRKLYVIENPVDKKHLENQVSNEDFVEKENRIISMGRLEPQKDFKTLINAFAGIADNVPGWFLDIYGIGPMEHEIRHLIKELDMSNRITLCGRTNKPYLEMMKSKIFVLSSYYEGFPNVLCEAMCTGAICISSDCVSGPAEIISNGKNGYLFEVENTKGLEGVLLDSITNYENLEQLRINAMKSVERLDVHTIVGKWIKLLEEVVEK